MFPAKIVGKDLMEYIGGWMRGHRLILISEILRPVDSLIMGVGSEPNNFLLI